ncbi:Peptidyl-prolyl cis-trans isomerase (rotamase) -cyclophilin family [Arsukibacterium tuosuense]|uniref:Peptidyl-prolyl cis-trans isomerase n=1 Tax=Arsukibacterium tuosuense TaxID=1323745 RepID=A0A285IPY6_9GAMM|nr:peptidylprolyl isomerase [Arsukibacterium tuosuense]SNY49156.1 Peptidyl-prolyl cis-trans isomerase (rotamase) -cyclophilin family [Arsukibacterium tuosuense]
MSKPTFVSTLVAATMLLVSQQALATIVQVKTSLGDFEVNLFDETTPVTVQNFLSYVNSGRYDETVIHRSVPGFIIQGGGFRFDEQLPLTPIQTNAAIVNEPKLSNVRATIAMAKLPGNPNSATSQWFINLADNSAGSPRLDIVEGAYTVFGQITAADMEVVMAIANLPTYNFTGIEGLPLRNYTANDRADNVPLNSTNMVTVESITVVDARPNSAAGLNPVPNTLLPEPESSSGSSSLALLLLGPLLWWRRRQQ